ncbi:MAG: hypothetical protein JRI95_09820, partial [Deltaproteobacteria bacterium]|nr:hypothetical protein [Deltaproteobacteria bacterium]
DQHLHYVHNFLNIERYKITSEIEAPTGSCALGFEFEKTGTEKLGAGGIGRLCLNGKLAGAGKITRTSVVRYHLADDGLCCGYDSQTPTSEDYDSPFRFSGKLKRVIVNVNGDSYSDPELEYKIAMAKQ